LPGGHDRSVARLTRLTIAFTAAVVLGWALFLASMSLLGPSGAFCFDPGGARPPDQGCVHVSVDPVSGRGISNHETSRTDAAGITTWYHAGTAVTGPIAAPMFVSVPILTALIYLGLGAIERRGRPSELTGRAVRPEARRP
jgi:hypothetical protein